MKRKTFFDSRDKYLSFVNSTNEKSKIAFYLFERIEKISTRSPIFNVLDAGTGEGTIISTFLSGLHKSLPKKPIFVVGKEISIDDINVLLSFLGDRFAEHKTLIFNITNCSYKDLNNFTSDNVKFEKLELVGKKGIDFTKILMSLSPYVKKNWKLSFNNKNGSIKPKSKIFLTIYRKDYQLINPSKKIQKLSVNKAIKLVKMGNVKSAAKAIKPAIDSLIKMKCKKIILGCTELPIAIFAFKSFENVKSSKIFLDPNLILAHSAMVKHKN